MRQMTARGKFVRASSVMSDRRQHTFPAIAAKLNRLVRGFLLVLWISALSWFAFQSLPGNRDLFTATNQARPVYSFYLSPPKECSVHRILESYLKNRSDPPPIEAILDIVLPSWKEAIQCDDGRYWSLYWSLFSKVEDRLRSLALNEAKDPKNTTLDSQLLPPEFAGKARNQPVSFPPEAQDWISRESGRIKNEEQALALFSTFTLLSVLGAFGALIFLIRDYITVDRERKLSDYIFRPILGIFLAVAVFVVDVLAHSVISTSSILQIRPEPLYILALGAGLLSETAYDWVRRNINSTFASRERQLVSGQENAPPEAERPIPPQ